MATIPLSERQRAALREFMQLAAWRAQTEADTESGYRARQEAAEHEFQEAQKKVQSLFDAALMAAERQVQDARQKIAAQYDQDHHVAAQEVARAEARANHVFALAKEKIEAEFKESRWTITTVYDADKKVAKEQRTKTESRAETSLAKIVNLHQEARALLAHWKCADLNAVPADLPVPGEEDPCRAMQQCTVLANTKLQELKALTYPRTLKKLPWLCALAWMVLTAPSCLIVGGDLLASTGPDFLFDEKWYFWVAGSTALVGLLGLTGRFWLKRKTRTQAAILLREIYQAQADGEKLRPRCFEAAKNTYRQQRADSKKRNQDAMRQVIHQSRQLLRQCTAQRDRQLQEAQDVHAGQLLEISRRRQADLNQAESTYQRLLADGNALRDSELQQTTQKFARLRDENNRRHAQEYTHLVSAWKQGSDKFLAVVGQVDRDCRRLFPSWDDTCWNGWQPPDAIPHGIRFGELGLTMERIPAGVSTDPQMPRPHLGGMTFPALLAFPQKASLLLRTKEGGRVQAVAALQALLLRCLTAIPPGKVRFTIMDPVGRGENFAAFMHLADHDEQLVTSRIWTEPAHIDQRLADLTAHMENVIQKYLRNQYETLEEYNAQAGEVAEPFRILVVANFPVNFSPESARRLVSLAGSGARSGIYTFISVDTKQPLPQGFNLADLEQACLILDWQEQGFVWQDADFALFPLTLERPPAAEFSTRLMQVVGRRAKIAGRVEVPFDYVAPAPEKYWTGDTRLGIAVALGRAGATGRQFLQLGLGTAQHALVGGKTGSGKSTLLHALITQLALAYSPDEVALYLVDFKKGVEFKTYASHELPHARVVAIESEREFGLSVLQRLDTELKIRGERFRQRGVNDLPSYRQLGGALVGDNGSSAMPRIMLIIDEFQEFFVEDDKIAQEAALLLDRLVRQGRAFGVHVLLGSQTLGGAYSLARSTIDQMAVRIALQCSEADAHLILNKDNGAARLLSRPGEAIYNAAGGMLEGNNLFQVVWLSDERRDKVLSRVAELAHQRRFVPPQPQIIFEGTAPSDLVKNARLEQALADYPPATPPSALYAWLGEAIAIKDPTAALFRRQSGANVLMVGQQEEAAFRMIVSSLISLASQLLPNDHADPSFFLVVASPLEPAADDLLARLPELLAPHLAVMPVRDLPTVIANLADEVDRRLKSPGPWPPLFLFLHGLHRLRDLRRSEDDFGFSRRGEERQISPAKGFVNILREGPMVGVFTTVWCDNLNNLNRALDRQGLREFDMRVLGQMSAADSSNLIDSPLAAKLGMHRALFSTEDQGRLEKFRPYGLPATDWLEAVKAHLEKSRPRPVVGTAPK